jgi:hypothetical protein
MPNSESGQVLSRQALNRATLARQLLLTRSALPAANAVEHLVGLQAQTPHSWYTGLWTRLEDFSPQNVVDLINQHRLVRIALMRSTIHLVTAEDCLALRPLVQPVIERSMSGNFGRRLAGLAAAELIAAGRAIVDERPRTFGEIGALLAERWPDRDPAALAQAIRAWVPLIQVPPRGIWGLSGPIAHTSAEAWLGRPLTAGLAREELIRRYLAAFGPATVKDMQTWSGLTRLAEVVEQLRPQLVSFYDEHGKELFDLPDAPRPDPDTPAPVRFLYDYDNLLLSHADRTRFITEEYHQQGYTADGPMPSIVLIDGFTNASWKIMRQRGSATLLITPFVALSAQVRAELTEEGARLLAFAAEDAQTHDIQFTAIISGSGQ